MRRMRLGRLLLAALLGLLLVGSLTSSAHADPRWVFYTHDKTRYESPWFGGAHRIMVPFGCTSAPYYSPDARCDGHGFHHGLDVAMPCGTPLYAARRFRVVSNDSLGSAYGEHPLLLRNRKLGWDLVIGHTRRVYVREGQVVRRGTMYARASDSGAPDGCHLHFERRSVGGGLSTAVHPRPLLQLTGRER
jgi:murein DD-endopeptidase MepM/ murein hydrolase activator NlpD